jgi:pimeloyl-ACP methyl ester carboxylesterase
MCPILEYTVQILWFGGRLGPILGAMGNQEEIGMPNGVGGRGWAIAALLGGSLALVIGVGVGLRWLVAGIVSWQSIIGGLCLLAGVGLVAAGTARVGCGRSRSVRIGLIAFALSLVAVSVWTLSPAVIATVVPPTEHGGLTPADLRLEAREVTFLTRDGVTLWGWYVPSRNGAAVVLRHGSGSTASDVLAHAVVLAERGYGILMTDARGHGLSEGAAMDFGWFGDLDIEAAVSFLVARAEVDPGRIGVVGLSMGGEEAIGAASSDPRIAAVVAEGASARTEEDKAWLEDEYGWRGWLQLKLEWLQYAVTDLISPASRPVALATSAADMAPRPLLLVTAGERPDESHAAGFIQSVAGDHVLVWAVPGADHIGGLDVAPAAWEEEVVGFLDRELGR